MSSQSTSHGSRPGSSLDTDGARIGRALEDALNSRFLGGNTLTRLKNGEEIFPAMLDAIARAEQTVDFETYVYWGGAIAERIALALRDAANRGARVRVILDGVGSLHMPDGVREVLEKSPVELRFFRPPDSLDVVNLDRRTHRKILVCDGDLAFTGGVGIAEEWTGNARGPDEWRETHFRVRGPVTHLLSDAFQEHWVASSQGSEDETSTRSTPVPAEKEGAEVQVVTSQPSDDGSNISTLFRTLVGSARRRLRIATAYFVPTEETLNLLCDAARRGVDVQVMLPGTHTDQRASQLAGEDMYLPLLEAGVRIHSYERTMLHVKVITVDGVLASIGSANFNHRSVGKDDEVVLNVLDRPLVRALEDDFQQDLEGCVEIAGPDGWEERSLLQRAGEYAARMLRSEL